MNKKRTFTLKKTPEIVEELYILMPRIKVFTFDGPLGAGKTTIIRLLLQKCGIKEAITSPTFTYVNVYKNRQKQTFYHFDLYRLYSTDEFVQAGFNEFLYRKNSWAFIEWPTVALPLLTHKVCTVKLDYTENDTRTVSYDIAE